MAHCRVRAGRDVVPFVQISSQRGPELPQTGDGQEPKPSYRVAELLSHGASNTGPRCKVQGPPKKKHPNTRHEPATSPNDVLTPRTSKPTRSRGWAFFWPSLLLTIRCQLAITLVHRVDV